MLHTCISTCKTRYWSNILNSTHIYSWVTEVFDVIGAHVDRWFTCDQEHCIEKAQCQKCSIAHHRIMYLLFSESRVYSWLFPSVSYFHLFTHTQREVEKAESQVHSEEQHHVRHLTEEKYIPYVLLHGYWEGKRSILNSNKAPSMHIFFMNIYLMMCVIWTYWLCGSSSWQWHWETLKSPPPSKEQHNRNK